MTAQIRERLIVNVATEMLSCPPLPEKHPRIVSGECEWRGSDNVRGYVGTWEIKNDRLYLVHLEGQFKLTRGKPLFADWVTGVIRIPMDDDVLKYFFRNLTAPHEVEIHVVIEKGKVIAPRKPEAIQGHLFEGGWSLDEQMRAQTRERLIFPVETEMLSCPPLPEKHPRIASVELEWWSSANRRGYVGTWEIKNDCLYLRALGGQFKLTRGKPLFADWVTGVICIPMGEVLKISPGMLGALHEVEMHVEIEQGKVIATRTVDNRGKKEEDVRGDVTGRAFSFL